MTFHARQFAVLAVAALLACPPAPCAGTAAWEMSSYQDFIKGRFQGISLSRDGRLMLAPRLDTLFSTEQPVIWSVVRGADGSLYAASGHRGHVYRVDPSGNGSVYWTSEQPEVFALAIDKQGVLYAGTSPDGRIYRIEGGKAADYFQPKTKYIWSLAFDSAGNLYAGTDQGKVFRVTAGGKGEVYYETGQNHVTSLLVDAEGRVLAGTEPNGILYRITAKDKAFVLYDADLPEIRAILSAPDGCIYAAAMGGSLAGRGAAYGTPVSISPGTAPVTAPPTTITVTETQAGLDVKPKPDASRPAPAAPQVTTQFTPALDMSGVEKSAVYRINPDNTVETLWSTKEENIYDLLAVGDYLVLSTDNQGRIYRLSKDRRITLLAQTNEGEAMRLMHDGQGVVAATGNLGKLLRLGEGFATGGVYESPVHDARGAARWGNLSWRASLCDDCRIQLRTRSGNSARPDRTWSDWSEPFGAQGGGLVPSPNARYVQWKLELSAPAGRSPVVENVTLAYQPQNTPPLVRTITVSAKAGAGAATSTATSGQPAAQTAYSITVSDTGEAASTSAGTPSQTFARGAAAQMQITWQAEDPDGDKLSYAIYFRGEGEREWKLLRSNHSENSLAIDADALADGRYQFRVVASDAFSNPPGAARQAELISSPVLIDSTPPVVTVAATRRNGSSVTIDVDAADAASALRRADYSLDAGPWTPLASADGVIDSRQERFVVELSNLPPGEHLVVIRVHDAAGNPGLAKVVLQ